MKYLCKLIFRICIIVMAIAVLSSGMSQENKAFAGKMVWVYSSDQYTYEMGYYPYVDEYSPVGPIIKAEFQITDLNYNGQYVCMGFKNYNNNVGWIVLWSYDYDANGKVISKFDRHGRYSDADFDYVMAGSEEEKLWQAAFNRVVERRIEKNKEK